MATYKYDLVGGKIVVEEVGKDSQNSFFNHEVSGPSRNGNLISIKTGSYVTTINPELDNLILNGNDIPAGSQTAEELFNTLNESEVFQSASSGGGTASGNLPINSKIGFQGNSIMAEGYVKNGNILYYNSNGIASWAMLFSNHKFKIPVNGIIATPGDTTGDTLGKLGASLNLKLAAIVIEIGTNDVALNFTAQSIIANLSAIYSAHIANGTKVIAIPILPRFGANALTAPQQAVSDEVNNKIKSFPGIQVVDINSQLVSGDFYDGLHPNKNGSNKIGAAVGKKLSSFIAKGNVADLSGNDTNILTNGILLNGTDGFISGGSGQLASGFNTSLYNITGATVALSKAFEDYKNVQIISITGNHTGDGDLTLAQDKTTALAINDILEGFVDFTIVNDTVGLKTINLSITVYDGANNVVQVGESLSTSGNNIPVSFKADRYQMRTPQTLLDNGSPASVRMNLKIVAHESVASEPINGVIKIHKIGIKKVLN